MKYSVLCSKLNPDIGRSLPYHIPPKLSPDDLDDMSEISLEPKSRKANGHAR